MNPAARIRRLDPTRRAPFAAALVLAAGLLSCPTPVRGEEYTPDAPGRAAWLNADWACRFEIAVRPDSIAGEGELLGVPLLLPLDDGTLPGIFARARPDGGDLVVTAGDGLTVLPREIVSFDAALHRAEIWLRADTLSRESRVFYLYCGNPDTLIAPADGTVWGEADLGIFHFAEDPGAGVLRDYGPHGHHATPKNGWTSADTTAGRIGQGWLLNGSTHWIDADAIASQDSSFTISAWFAVHDPLSPGADFAFQSETGYWHLSAKRNETHRNADFANANGFISWNPYPLPDTLLHHFAWILDGEADTLRFYFDGVEQTIRSRWAPVAPHKVYTGNTIGGNVSIAGPIWGNSQDLFEGIADEFRVHAGVLTAERILTEVRNQRAGAAFYTFGAEEIAAVPSPGALQAPNALLRAWPSPFGQRATIEWLLPQSHGAGELEILDASGRCVRRLAIAPSRAAGPLAVWDGRDQGGAELGNGVYLLRVRAAGLTGEGRLLRLR